MTIDPEKKPPPIARENPITPPPSTSKEKITNRAEEHFSESATSNTSSDSTINLKQKLAKKTRWTKTEKACSAIWNFFMGKGFINSSHTNLTTYTADAFITHLSQLDASIQKEKQACKKEGSSPSAIKKRDAAIAPLLHEMQKLTSFLKNTQNQDLRKSTPLRILLCSLPMDHKERDLFKTSIEKHGNSVLEELEHISSPEVSKAISKYDQTAKGSLQNFIKPFLHIYSPKKPALNKGYQLAWRLITLDNPQHGKAIADIIKKQKLDPNVSIGDIEQFIDSILRVPSEKRDKFLFSENQPLKEISSLRTKKLRHSKKLSLQEPIVQTMQGLGYKGDKEGMCFGYSLMRIQASLCGDRDKFNARIDRLNELIKIYGNSGVAHYLKTSQKHALIAIQEKKFIILTKEAAERTLEEYNDFMAFFQNLDGFQQANIYARDYPELFSSEPMTPQDKKVQLQSKENDYASHRTTAMHEQKSHPTPSTATESRLFSKAPIHQQDKLIESTALLFQSKALENMGGLDIPIQAHLHCSSSELFLFLNQLKNIVQDESTPTFSISLIANYHAVTIEYDKEKKGWLLSNINLGETQDISSDSDMTDEVLLGFFFSKDLNQFLREPLAIKVLTFCAKQDSTEVEKRLTPLFLE
jgi:hypothetical protein